MKRLRSFLATFGFAFALLFLTFHIVSASTSSSPSRQSDFIPRVEMEAEAGAEIDFHLGNDPKKPLQKLPHLVLYKNGSLAPAISRTLVLTVGHVRVEPGIDIRVEITATTQHLDPDGGPFASRIIAWHTIYTHSVPTTQATSFIHLPFSHEFTESIQYAGSTVRTPTDYFRIEVFVRGIAAPIPGYQTYTYAKDYAFLMENQRTTSLPEVSEEAPGAAPDKLIVYYCDMFPFRARVQRIPRKDVPDYVHTTFTNAITEAFRVQTDDWGMGPWDSAWNYGRDGGNWLSIALVGGGTRPEDRLWYHGAGQDDAFITMWSFGGGWGHRYDNVIDGHLSTFHHELFHNLQRNAQLLIDGSGDQFPWPFFTEGTATLATAVGQPSLQFLLANRQYMRRANDFLNKDLNQSYLSFEAMQEAAIYWRFLYEQCGGIDASGVEHPAIGMQVISQSLKAMYTEAPKLGGTPIEKMYRAMDVALASSPNCPFHTYEESLIAFARANYSLRLDDSEYYEQPSNPVYTEPPADSLPPYQLGTSDPVHHTGEITSSFGMDFAEVKMIGIASGTQVLASPLEIRFEQSNPDEEFHVQFLYLAGGTSPRRSGSGNRLRISPAYPNVETIPIAGGEGKRIISVRPNHLRNAPDALTHLGFIVVRLDTGEGAGTGAYTITLNSDMTPPKITYRADAATPCSPYHYEIRGYDLHSDLREICVYDHNAPDPVVYRRCFPLKVPAKQWATVFDFDLEPEGAVNYTFVLYDEKGNWASLWLKRSRGACSGPGGDHPDDSLSAASALLSSFDLPPGARERARVGVLEHGFFVGAGHFVKQAGEPYILVDLDFDPAATAAQYPVLVIPSGGLYGLESSPSFHARLEEYARHGGTIVAFAQQHGYEYAALPGGQVRGYGWNEDISCSGASLTMETWHPALSGLNRADVYAHVDGFFTAWPEDAQVLLSRKANGRPAAILYPYPSFPPMEGTEGGWIFATTMYDDWGAGHGQSYADARILLRDLLTWAIPDEGELPPADGGELEWGLPQFSPGDPVTLAISMTNTSAYTATTASLWLIDPARQVVLTRSVPITPSTSLGAGIPPNSTGTVVFTTTAASPLGIWRVDGQLLVGESYPLAGKQQVARYVVAQPPASVDPDSPLYLSITAPGAAFARDSVVPFTYHIYNYGDEPLVATLRYSIDHWGGWPVLAQGIVVPAADGDTPGEATYVYHRPITGRFRLRGRVDAGGHRAYASYGVLLVSAPIHLDASVHPTEVRRTGTLTLTMTSHQTQGGVLTTTLHVKALDAGHTVYHTDALVVPLDSGEWVTATHAFTVPLSAVAGTGWVQVEARSPDGRVGGGAYAPYAILSTSPVVFDTTLPEVLVPGTAQAVTVVARNTGAVPAEDGNLALTLADPQGVTTTLGSRAFGLQPGEVVTFTFPFTTPQPYPGEYTFAFAAVDEIGTRSWEERVASRVVADPRLDRPRYRVGDELRLAVSLTNDGGFQEDLEVSVEIPDAGYAETRAVLLLPGQQAAPDYTLTVPLTIGPGSHPVTVTLLQSGGSTWQQRLAFDVPLSELRTTTAQQEAGAGDVVALTVANVGGAPTTGTYELALRDAQGRSILDAAGSLGTLDPGGGEQVTFTVPAGAVTGRYYVAGRTVDAQAGRGRSFALPLQVDGAGALLEAQTEREVYAAGEVITATAVLNSTGTSLPSATLHLQVRQQRGGGPRWANHLPGDHGLAGSSNATVIDTEGHKWFATDNGVSVLDDNDTPDKSDDEWVTHTTADGLVSNWVTDVAIDASGNKWFTGSGVSVLDDNGTPFDKSDDTWATFTRYDEGVSLPGSSVYAVAIDVEGRKWFATSGGVGVLDDGGDPFDGTGDTWQAYTTADGLVYYWVRDITIDATGYKWIATSKGVSVFDDNDTPFIKGDDDRWLTLTDELASYRVEVVEIDETGRVWFGHDSYAGGRDVSVLDYGGDPFDGSGDTWQQFTATGSGATDNQVHDIVFDEAGRVWFGTWSGVSVLDYGTTPFDGSGDTWQRFTATTDEWVCGQVPSIAIDTARRKWVGTCDGASMFDDGDDPFDGIGDTWLTFSPGDTGLAEDDVIAIAVDAKGRKWFGTWSSGVSVLDDSGTPFDKSDDRWVTFTTADGLAEGEIEDIVIDAEGRVWLGTWGGGVSVLDYGSSPFDKDDGDQWQTFTAEEDGLGNNVVLGITVDVENYKWFATWGGGVSVLDDQGDPFDKGDGDRWQTFTTVDGLADDDVGAIAIDAEGRKWFSVRDDLYVLDDRGDPFDKGDGDLWQTFTYDEGVTCGAIEALAIDAEGHIWSACYYEAGVFDYGIDPFDKGDGDRWLLFPYEDNYGGVAIAIDTDGRKWFGTEEGVKMLDDGGSPFDTLDDVWTTFTVADGLVEDNVYAVAIDRAGYKWFGGYGGGVSVYGEDSAIDGLNDAWGTFAVGDYGLADDWVYVITIDGAGYKWFGTGDGVNVFDDGGTPFDRSDDTWRKITADDTGLVYDGARTIAVDGVGRVWFGTYAGVSVLDYGNSPFDEQGDDWQTFTTADGMVDNCVDTIAVDASGRVWFGTQSGVSVLDYGDNPFDGAGDTWTTFTAANSGLAGDYVQSIAADAEGRVWFGAGVGVSVLDYGDSPFDGVGDAWITFTETDGLAHTDVRAIAIDATGHVWFGTYAGVSVLDYGDSPFDGVGDTWTTFTAANSGLANDSVRAVAIDAGGRVWFGTGAGVSMLDYGDNPFDGVGDAWTTFTTANSGLANDSIEAVAVDPAGHKWFGTYGSGVSVLDEGSITDDSDDAWGTFAVSDYGLVDDDVNAIAIDATGRKWLGTDGGVSVLDDGGTPFDRSDDAWRTFTPVDGLPNDYTIAIAVDAEGRVWFGTPAGVSVLDYGNSPFDGEGDAWTTFTAANSGLAGDYVQSIAADAAGRVWFGAAAHGVSVFDYGDSPFDGEGDTWTTFTAANSGLANNWVTAVAIDAAGRKWFATDGGGASVFNDGGDPFDTEDGDEWQTFTRDDGFAWDDVSTVAIDAAGRVWFGTYSGGVSVLDYGDDPFDKSDGDEWQTFTTADGLAHADVRAIAVDAAGHVWVGTGWHGVSVLDDGGDPFNKEDGDAWTTYTEADGLVGDWIRAIVVDSTGCIWFGTEWGGVSVFGKVPGGQILWQQDIPVDLSPGQTLTVDAVPGALGATGKLYLEATLTSPTGQVVATDEYPFYIFPGDLALTMDVDATLVRPGQPIALGGEVRNTGTVTLTNRTLAVTQDGTTIYTAGPFDLPPGGSIPYSTIALAPAGPGTTRFEAGVGEVKVEDTVQVVEPSVEVDVQAPAFAGSQPFSLTVGLENTGPLDAQVEVTIDTSDMQHETRNTQLSIPAGETHLLQETYRITQDTTFTVTLAGDVTRTIAVPVAFGEAATAAFSPEPVYPEGTIAIPYTLTNTGQLPLEFTTFITIQSPISTLQFPTYLPAGTATSGDLILDLPPGDYTLTYVTPFETGSVSFRVLPLTGVELSAEVGPSAGSVVTITAAVTNTGLLPLDGTLRLQTPFFAADHPIHQPTNLPVYHSLPLDLTAAEPGAYTATLTLLAGDGSPLASAAVPIAVPGPDLVLTTVPTGTVVQAGEWVTLTFGVENRGSTPATAAISVTVGDLLDEVQVTWLPGGEEGTLDFVFRAPDGLSGESLVCTYRFEGQRHDFALTVAGVDLDVTAGWDQAAYTPGDTAVLQLAVANGGTASTPPMYVHVAYQGEVTTRPLTLAGGESAALDFALTAGDYDADPKVFYALYEAGEERGVYLNTTYLYLRYPDVTLVPDRHVYEPGDTVHVTIVTTATGALQVAAPGFTSTIQLPASGFQFILPANLARGTYTVDYALLPPGGGEPEGEHSVLFDVDAPWVRVTEARLLGLPYAPGGDVQADLTIASTHALDVSLRAWLVYPDGTRSTGVTETISLQAVLNNHVTLTLPLSTTQAGPHRLIYVLADPIDPDRVYAAGSETFDVGAVTVLGVRTDRETYPYATDPVTATLTVYAAAPTGASLELIVDDTSAANYTLALTAGVQSVAVPVPGPIAPDWHDLEARAEAGGLSSAAHTTFAYGTDVADLVVAAPQVVDTPGLTRTLRVRVINRGSTDAAATTVRVWDGDLDEGGVSLGVRPLPALAPGESARVELTWDVAGQAGPHTLVAVVDPDDVVAEFHEYNNLAVADVVVPAFDLAAEPETPSAYTGDPVAITIRASNLAPAPASVVVTTTAGSVATGTVVFTDVRVLSVPPAAQASATVVWDTAGLEVGAYAIRVWGTNQDGEQAEATATVWLVPRPLPPEVDAGLDRVASEGDAIAFSGTISDTDTPAGHTIVWDFGDGAAAAGTLAPTHVYADDGVYPVTLTVTDTTGLTAFDGLTVTVENVPPQVDAGPDQAADEGGIVHFGGAFTDPGTLDTHTIAWDFGDGSATPGTLTPTHTYAENGTYTVTLTVADDDGGVGSDALVVTIKNVPPAVDAGPDQVVDEGEAVHFDGTFTDPGTLDTHTIVWDFGDGIGTTGTLMPTHAYAEGGVYTATLTVADDDGGVGMDEVVITVLGAITGTPSADVGDYAILGLNSVWMQYGSHLYGGHVGVQDESVGPVLDPGAAWGVGGGHHAFLCSAFRRAGWCRRPFYRVEVSIGPYVTFHDSASAIAGDTVRVKPGAAVFDVFYNEIKVSPHVTHGQLNTPVDLPLVTNLPPFPEVQPGSTGYRIGRGESLELPAGAYGEIELKSRAVLTLTGGVYHFAGLEAGYRSRIVVTAPTEIRIAGRLKTGPGAFVGPAAGSGLGGADLVIFVAGTDGRTGRLGGYPKAASIGCGNVVVATIYAPNGTVWLGPWTEARGAFVGRDVLVSVKAEIWLESAFAEEYP